ncbi:MAG: PilZ domain-containing protein [Fibrobacteria bacterium]|nr:PilZ domain-containing protein [Fibrobacteria bacterium]
MNYRPIPIIILGLLHILEPFVKIPFYAYFAHKPILEYTVSLFTVFTGWEIVSNILLFPIAGAAILAVKTWSLPLIYLIEGYVAYKYFDVLFAFYAHGEYSKIAIAVLFFLINIIVVTYFLISAARQIYWDKSKRWWEQKIRYLIPRGMNLKVNIQYPEMGAPSKPKGGEVLNVSESGILLSIDHAFHKEQNVNLQFTFEDVLFNLRGVIMRLDINNKSAFGIKFTDIGLSSKLKLKKLIRTFKKMKCERRPERISFLKRMKQSITLKFS